MRARGISGHVIGFMIAITTMLGALEGHARAYPVNTCVGVKMASAATYCQSVLQAYGTWDKNQDSAKLDAALSNAATKLADKWQKAEATATTKGVDCAATTLTKDALKSMVDTSVGDIVTGINTGLPPLGNNANGRCGKKLLNAAAAKCAGLLNGEATFIKALARDKNGTARNARKAKVSKTFAKAWTTATANGCPTTATVDSIEASIDDLNDDVVTATTVSPNVNDTKYTTISPTGPIRYQGRDFTPTCMNSSPYYFFVKRGSVNKLVMYYQGGGACWEQLTCGYYGQAVCKTSVDPSGSDNLNVPSAGFADLTNPANPFKDWNIVFVAYCSCDIHYGDAAQDYVNIDETKPVHVEHRGFHNAKVAEKWAREHFVNPEMVFVTGSSAGAYGAVFHAPLLHKVWPASTFRVLGDAGNGVITTEFLQNEFNNWRFKANLPRDIPGVIKSINSGTGMVGYTEAVAKHFPKTNWAHYATAYDGGSGGQTGFYNVMLNDNDPFAALTWWKGSCAFNTQMVVQATETEAAVAAKNDNYRYYIGTGSRHTMWGSNKVYTDTTGGVPLLVDWVNAMLTGGPDWATVEASPFNVLLSGDPQPSPLKPPFVQPGANVEVNCP